MRQQSFAQALIGTLLLGVFLFVAWRGTIREESSVSVLLSDEINVPTRSVDSLGGYLPHIARYVQAQPGIFKDEVQNVERSQKVPGTLSLSGEARLYSPAPPAVLRATEAPYGDYRDIQVSNVGGGRVCVEQFFTFRSLKLCLVDCGSVETGVGSKSCNPFDIGILRERRDMCNFAIREARGRNGKTAQLLVCTFGELVLSLPNWQIEGKVLDWNIVVIEYFEGEKQKPLIFLSQHVGSSCFPKIADQGKELDLYFEVIKQSEGKRENCSVWSIICRELALSRGSQLRERRKISN